MLLVYNNLKKFFFDGIDDSSIKTSKKVSSKLKMVKKQCSNSILVKSSVFFIH